jgi:hypothetical protein
MSGARDRRACRRHREALQETASIDHDLGLAGESSGGYQYIVTGSERAADPWYYRYPVVQ